MASCQSFAGRTELHACFMHMRAGTLQGRFTHCCFSLLQVRSGFGEEEIEPSDVTHEKVGDAQWQPDTALRETVLRDSPSHCVEADGCDHYTCP